MPDSLLLDGVDDFRQFSKGDWAGSSGWTVAAIYKPLESSSPSRFLPIISGTSGSNWAFLRSVSDTINYYNGTLDENGNTIPINQWVLVANTKAAGAAIPQFHIYDYEVQSWDSGSYASVATNMTPNSDAVFGSGYDEPYNCNLLIAGLWDTNLSITTLEGMISTKQSWIDAAPDLGIRFDSAGTLTPFAGSSTQTGQTGGTLDTGDAPVGWTDGADYPHVSWGRTRTERRMTP